MTSYLSLFQFGIPSFPILLSINGNKVIATGLLYFLFLASSTGQSPLNGVYTIGGENPDFEKFSDATAALIVDGINGPVTFNVRDGNYNEHILIRNINGSNKDTPVIFQGESGDPSKCQITYDAFNSTGNYVVKLSKVEGVQFKNISLKALDLLRYSDVIVLDSSHHITFENMILESLGDDNRYEKTIVTVSESNNCTIKNNHFIGGCWGISSNSRFGDEPTVSGINIIGNTFQDQALRGIALHGNRNISIITNNFIRANRFSFVDSDYIGIFLYECDNGLRLEKNSMYTNRAGTSLSIESYDGTAEFPAIIANNFLYEGFSGSNEGISVESSTFLYFYYNSVNIKNHREIFSISRGSNNIKLFNNIIYNSRPSGGIPISIEEDALVAADYNNYFSENNNFFVDNKSLRDWQEATSFDAHSYSVDPQFIINNSFAISNPILNNAGLFLADFPKDIDGTLRNSTPDIGADEFSPIMSTDLRVDALTQPSSIFEPGNQEIKVQITNTGNANLTGGTLVWTVNGEVQPTSSWAKVIPEGTRDTLSLGSYNFLDGKPYIIEVISQATNDTITSNDTLLVDNIFSGISGVYTIGEGADFPNFQTATNALQFGGVLGEVTFNVLDGVYEEAILLKEIKYKEVNHPITFQSASGERSGVIVQHSATALVDNYVLSLYDEQNITFQNMTLQALGNEYSNVISLGNDVANITFENLVIENTSDSLVDGSNANTLLSISSFSQNIQIKNNLFKNGVYGVSYETIYRSRRLSGIVLSGNTFVDQRDRSVFITQIDDLIIRKNTFDSKYETYRPIYLFDSAEGLELIQNKINSMGVYGIFLSSCLGNAASPGLIANNFVNINSEKVPSGIILDNSSNLNVYHNSVVVKSGDIDYHQAAFKLDESTDIQMANNIFAYKGNMGAIYSFESTFSSDYNALFSNALIAVKGVQPSFGKVNPLGYSTLEKWQEETQTETNSFVILPEFISETDLHTFDLNLNSAGIGNLGIFEDIDGETRDLPFPDIGADEFSVETTECPTQDVLLRNQSDIDNFVSNHSTCDSLPASLTIQGSEVLDISSLAFLKYIGQNLTIANTKLDDLTGLSEIIFIGGAIKITNNDSLSSLSGLPNVTTIFGDLDISNNHNLTDCNAICLLIHNDAIVGSINIANNPTPCGNISEVRLFCVPIGCTNGPDVVANMLPANGAAGLTSPVSFSWIPVENAFQYFFKIWKEGEEIPILPIKITDQNTVNYEIAPSTTYHWQVFSVNPNCSTVSPIQSFTTAPFNISDLIIPDVEVPLNPFSGQSIELSWEVKNQGSASTNIAGWYDYVYLSKDSIFQPNIDELLGASSSPVVLEVNENTTQRLQTTLPEGIDGTHYIFVVTDKTKFINEAIESNNVSAPYPMRLTLTPPPDLLVSDIITPGTVLLIQVWQRS